MIVRCVIVEMVTRCQPYPDLLPHEAAMKVAAGLRPELPTNKLNFPPQFVSMFDSCFARAPEFRPSFHSICDVRNWHHINSHTFNKTLVMYSIH
jgi:hypothetical protein